MFSIFISHSSRDDSLANQIEAWLRANGFADVYVDHSKTPAGEDWWLQLQRSAGACKAIVCLVTENWLDSFECVSEFRAGGLFGKRIIPLFLVANNKPLSEEASKRLARVKAHDQGLDLRVCVDVDGILDFSREENIAALLRQGLVAAGALSTVGLDPEAFKCDPSLRPSPFPGLASFGDDDADAALFFGRSAEVADALEQLRVMRVTGDRRAFAILGASGAGKSSLLNAGIIPRLRREMPAWIAMRSFRPGADPLQGLAEAIARTLGDFGVKLAKGDLCSFLLDSWKLAERSRSGELTPNGLESLRVALNKLGEQLRIAANRPDATILVSLDQADELVRFGDRESWQATVDYIRVALGASTMWMLALTVRSDGFARLQDHPELRKVEMRGFVLRALPAFRLENVIEQPARRYNVKIEPALIEALASDAPDSDTLPLLAFAIQCLWDQFSSNGILTLENYRTLGGMAALVQNAAECALCGFNPEEQRVGLPPSGPSRAQIELAARVFVPALADVDESGFAKRRVAYWKDFDESAQDLLTHFSRWRLVVKKGETSHDSTVEVAHEALFREWSRLRDWLRPEQERLETLRALRAAAELWRRNGHLEEYLTHKGRRLSQAMALRKDERFRKHLTGETSAYLASCRSTLVSAITRTVGWVVVLAFMTAFFIVLPILSFRDAADNRKRLIAESLDTLELVKGSVADELKTMLETLEQLTDPWSTGEESPQQLIERIVRLPLADDQLVIAYDADQRPFFQTPTGSLSKLSHEWLESLVRSALDGDSIQQEPPSALQSNAAFLGIALPLKVANRTDGALALVSSTGRVDRAVRNQRPIAGWEYAVLNAEEAVVAGRLPSDRKSGAQVCARNRPGPAQIALGGVSYSAWSERFPKSRWLLCAWRQNPSASTVEYYAVSGVVILLIFIWFLILKMIPPLAERVLAVEGYQPITKDSQRALRKLTPHRRRWKS